MREEGIITPCHERPIRYNFVETIRAIYKDARAKAGGRRSKENPAKDVDLEIKKKKLEMAGFQFDHHGARHDVYRRGDTSLNCVISTRAIWRN